MPNLAGERGNDDARGAQIDGTKVAHDSVRATAPTWLLLADTPYVVTSTPLRCSLLAT